MAKSIVFIRIDQMQSVKGGSSLDTATPRVRYVVKDSEDPDNDNSGRVSVPDIDTSDTIADWWASLIAAIEAKEGIS